MKDNPHMNIKTSLMTILALASISANVQAASISIEKKQNDFSWTIDNSKFGGVDKASEIKWKSSPAILKLSEDFSFGSMAVYYGQSQSEFTDNDWCFTQNGKSCSAKKTQDILNYSNESALSGSFKTVGISYSGVFYNFESVPYLDSFTLSSKIALEYSKYKAKGLHSNITNTDKYGEDVTVNKTELVTLDTNYYLNLTKKYGLTTFRLSPFVGIKDLYMEDHHPLRKDRKNLRFRIMDVGINYGADISVKYRPTQRFSVELKGGVSNYAGFIASAVTVKENGKEGVGVGMGENKGLEKTLAITINYEL